MERHSVSVTEV